MKLITQERLIRAIAKIDAASANNAEMTRQTEIVQALSLHGLKSVLESEVNASDKSFARKWQAKIYRYLKSFYRYLKSIFGFDTALNSSWLKAELKTGGLPKTEAEFFSLIDSWQTKIHHYHAKCEKVWEIQKTHGVSGLSWHPSDFDSSFSVPWVDESLNLIDPDLEILSKHKPLHLQRWIDFTQGESCSFYRWTKKDGQNEWEPISVADLCSISPYYQWCHTWNHSTIFYLLLGNGKDTDSAESDTAWFCATKPNVRPHY